MDVVNNALKAVVIFRVFERPALLHEPLNAAGSKSIYHANYGTQKLKKCVKCLKKCDNFISYPCSVLNLNDCNESCNLINFAKSRILPQVNNSRSDFLLQRSM